MDPVLFLILIISIPTVYGFYVARSVNKIRESRRNRSGGTIIRESGKETIAQRAVLWPILIPIIGDWIGYPLLRPSRAGNGSGAKAAWRRSQKV
jgi:hypothetical protein